MSKTWGIVAEFPTTAAIYEAAKKTTDSGYTRVDAHTPFPVHDSTRPSSRARARWAGSC